MTDERLEAILERYKGQKGALIPVLQDAQETFGYLSEETLEGIARGLRMPFSQVYGVVYFY
ncbi:MAG: NAD(P)H-dependent oxidoreductase subunit E [bacterium]